MKKRKANIGRKSNDAKHTRKSRQKKKMLQKDPKITASSGSTTSGQWKRKSRQKLWTDQLMDSIAEEEDVVVEKIEETEILAPKVQEFQSPEVEQPNDDRIQMPDSIEGGAQGWVAWLTDDPLGLAGVHKEDRCRLVGGLIAIGIIIILMIVILCMSFKLLGFESYLF